MAHLTPRQQVVALALELLGSVSAERLKKAVEGGRQSSVLVDPYVFGRLATLLEEQHPGVIAQVREANKRRDDAHRAEVRRVWEERARQRAAEQEK